MALNTFRIKVGDNWYTVQVGDLANSPVEVIVEGETFQVEVEGFPLTGSAPGSEGQPSPPRRGRRRTPNLPASQLPSTSSTTNFSENILRSPMPGRVISILVRPGDRVSAGDEVCVVEAMKMEQSVRAHRDGIVKEIFVQPTDPVKADDPLVELE